MEFDYVRPVRHKYPGIVPLNIFPPFFPSIPRLHFRVHERSQPRATWITTARSEIAAEGTLFKRFRNANDTDDADPLSSSLGNPISSNPFGDKDRESISRINPRPSDFGTKSPQHWRTGMRDFYVYIYFYRVGIRQLFPPPRLSLSLSRSLFKRDVIRIDFIWRDYFCLLMRSKRDFYITNFHAVILLTVSIPGAD